MKKGAQKGSLFYGFKTLQPHSEKEKHQLNGSADVTEFTDGR